MGADYNQDYYILLCEGEVIIGIFDIIGPVMVGPSSSHTAGAVHLGLFARELLSNNPLHAEIELHGSFNYTGEGHGTHLAILGGILGLATDDERIPLAKKIADETNLTYNFTPIDLGEVHPNSVRITLTAPANKVSICGSSLGGGKISVWKLNRYPVELYGIYPTLLLMHNDHPGVVAKVTGKLAKYCLNIAAMKLYRNKRGGEALMSLELDQAPQEILLESLRKLPEITDVRFIPIIINR